MSYTIEQLEIGRSASVEKRITQSEVLTFADLSGDINPVHIDEAHAKASVCYCGLAMTAFAALMIFTDSAMIAY